jgi:peptidase E
MPAMRTVVLLGPQRLRPTLVEAVDRAGVRGSIAAVTAGWQEREDEIDELSEHLKRSVVNLRLHHRGEDALARDPELLLAYGDHLDRRRQMQDLYRIRLRHEKASIRELLSEPMDPAVVAPEVERAMAALRALDVEHRSRVRRLEAAFEAEWKPAARPVVAEHRAEVAEVLSRCEALAIAGGHVQVLLDRLRLFGVAEASGELAVFAWSAGAMVACEAVVLFHDSPPQGANDEEVLSDGLGLCDGVVALPHARRRLALDDPGRVRLLAKRFRPARCFALDEGSVAWCRGDAVELRAGRELKADGSVAEAAVP